MTVDGQGGSFDGHSKQIDLKAHFQGLKELQSERRIATEAARVALELSQHRGVFGFEEDNSRDDVAVNLIKSLNPDVNHFSELGNEDQKIIGRAVFMGLNMTCSEGISDGLLTDMVSDSDINSIVPEAFKGVGKLVKDVELTKNDVDLIVSVNKTNTTDGVFDTRSINERGEILSNLSEIETTSPIGRAYLILERDLILGLGVPEVPNVTVSSLNMVEDTPKRATDEKKSEPNKERKPGPTTRLNETMTDVGGKVEELTGAIGKQTKSTEKNTAALDLNTLAVRELTTSANLLGVDVRNLTTAISKEHVTKIVAQLRDSGVDFASLTDSDRDEISIKLAREVDDPSVVDSKNPQNLVRARELKLELEKAMLLHRFDKKIVDNQKGRRRGGETDIPPENREGWDGSVDALYRWLNEIEHGDRSVDDLSTNSTKFGFLYHAKNSEYDNYFKSKGVVAVDKNNRLVLESGEKEVGKRSLTEEELAYMKYEIDMRLFLHSFYRAASKCATIDDMAKVIISMHEGDIENMGDKAIVSFFLNRVKDSGGVGLEKLPTDIAWNMRQEGYFRIEQFTERVREKKMDFFEGFKKIMAEKMGINVNVLDGLGEVDTNGNISWEKITDMVDGSEVESDTFKLFKKIAKFDSTVGKWVLNTNGFDELTKFKVEIPAMPQFNFNKPVNQNLDCFEQRNELSGVLIKEYTIWRIMESNKGKYSQDKARKAYTLARRLAVATFMKNKANLIFDQDDYAEKLNFMFERLEDGPWGKDGLEGKGKLVGARETLGFVHSLTPHWMDTLKSDFIGDLPRQFESVYSPIYSNDLDWDKYNYRTTQIYHALGILSQVEFVDDAWRNKCTPNDVNTPGFLNKLFSKMNKLSYEMEKTKVKSLEIKDKPDIYNRFMATKDGKINPKDEGYVWAKRHLAESFRYVSWASGLRGSK